MDRWPTRSPIRWQVAECFRHDCASDPGLLERAAGEVVDYAGTKVPLLKGKSKQTPTHVSRDSEPAPALNECVDQVARHRLPCAANQAVDAMGRCCTGRTGPMSAGWDVGSSRRAVRPRPSGSRTRKSDVGSANPQTDALHRQSNIGTRCFGRCSRHQAQVSAGIRAVASAVGSQLHPPQRM